jgi:ABC-type antimicrobial peptide transport system permease subunit
MRERLLARLSTGFGLLALLLAVVGLFGVMSYVVARRERETGIRIALGATSGAMLRRVLREALAVSLLGVAIGIGATVAVSRVVSSFLFDLSPNDPLTLGGVAVVLVSTTLVAALLPARRAAAVDPIRAIRAE